jgi:3-deoxy-D-manno-octulosonic-acid transferase
MRPFYNLVVRLAAPLAFAVVLLRGLRDRAYWQALGERFGFGARAGEGAIWLHAVSLGEVTAAAPIVRALRERQPAAPLVLTTSTPTGRARGHALFGSTVEVRFLPYDTPGAVARFLARVAPRIGVILETELWPNLHRECARRGIPLVLANARLSARSVARYRRMGALVRGLLTENLTIAAQSGADAERFAALGAPAAQIHVVGNIKYDLRIDAALVERGRSLRRHYLGSRPVWVAGSTHPGEEEQVLGAHGEILRRHATALLVLVPRHPQRFDAVADLLGRGAWRAVRRTGVTSVPPQANVLLLDTVGELLDFYGAADAAFVGGSLVPIGGHNLLEPAAFGVPVITGPSDFNAAAVASLLLGLGAARRVANADELARAVSDLVGDDAERRRVGDIARLAVDANRGSTERVLALIARAQASATASRAPAPGPRPGERP